MPRLARQYGQDPVVAEVSVHAPAYTMTVAATGPTTGLPDDWVYVEQDITADDVVPVWVQPAGSQDAYGFEKQVVHADKRWASTVENNVWEPGVSGWREVPLEGEHPEWVQPTGAHDAYEMDFVVLHSGKTWRSLRDANVWEPGTFDAGWDEIIEILPEPKPPASWVDTGVTITQLVGAGIYRVSGIPSGLVVGQDLRLGDTATTKFNGYWPVATTPSDHITIAPHVSAAVGSVVWVWK